MKTETEQKNREKTILTYSAKWQNINLKITLSLNYFFAGNVAHLELESEEPNPISLTGYRSCWIMEGKYNNEPQKCIDDILVYMNECAQKKKWLQHVKEETLLKQQKLQLCFF